MKTVEGNVVRLAVVQHLRATYGIKTKNWNKNKSGGYSKLAAGNSVKVFGVALESLPHMHVLDYGDVPCFLVDACSCLMEHLDTEGLFRKSGSIVRVKALRAKLDSADECLSMALPLDLTDLLKQFFRELPEPVLPPELQGAFLKAQELASVEERTAATVLLSCVLPQPKLGTLRYFFNFLKRVSQRCATNKMDSSNLSVILAPNFLYCGEVTEKMKASTEKKLKLQAAVVQCLIDNAEDFGLAPEFLLAKIPAMLGCETGASSPSESMEDGHTPSVAKRSRRSLGDVVNGALNKLKSSRTPSGTPHSGEAVLSAGSPVIMTPKRKLPTESGHSYGFSTKKRKSLKMNLGLELFPSALFGGGSTPGSVHSASGALDSSHNALSSVGRSSRLTASSTRRKSKRLSQRNVGRAESGKAGCFSPRVTKKEATRKSLRQRFSLGKPSRDCRVISQSLPVPKVSEVIGWRLATQDSVGSFHVPKDTAFSPAVLRSGASKGSKYISKSEDNLLTPGKATEARPSWSPTTPNAAQVFTGSSFSDTPMNACLRNSYRSEPAIVISKPPATSSIPKSLCCATSSGSLASSESLTEEASPTGPTLIKIVASCEESTGVSATSIESEGAEAKDDLKDVELEPQNSSEQGNCSDVPKKLVDDSDITFGQIEIVPLSPLHIDSALFDIGSSESLGSAKDVNESNPAAENESGLSFEEISAVTANCSRLIDALDIQSPVAFRFNSSNVVQSTPFSWRGGEREEEVDSILNERAEEVSATQKASSVEVNATLEEEPNELVRPEKSSNREVISSVERRAEVINQPPRTKVAEHIQRFNMLTLNSPRAKAASRSPLKFQRTPVRQSVRRINSILGQRKEARAGWCATSRGNSVTKALSLESGLSTTTKSTMTGRTRAGGGVCLDTKAPAVFKKPTAFHTVRHCALGDVTNIAAPKNKADTPSEAPKCIMLPAERDASHYRGSPRNPLMQGKLLSAMKPIDL